MVCLFVCLVLFKPAKFHILLPPDFFLLLNFLLTDLKQKMLESRPEDALVKLVKLVNFVKLVKHVKPWRLY